MIKNLPSFLTASAVFILDRLTKAIVIQCFEIGDGFVVIPGILEVTRVNNTGAAFGMFRGFRTTLLLISAASVLAIAFYLWRSHHPLSKPLPHLTRYCWALILGGAAGNLYDRWVYGHVVDFIDFRIWPVFNVADMAIFFGVVGIMWHFVRRKE